MVGRGVTIDGTKIMLGIEQIHSENGRAIEQGLDRLVERGLKFENGILFIIDGSKGIKKAIEHKFSVYALIQRCRWHKQRERCGVSRRNTAGRVPPALRRGLR